MMFASNCHIATFLQLFMPHKNNTNFKFVIQYCFLDTYNYNIIPTYTVSDQV